MTENNDYDVIVVGAGPTGAVLAALLGQAAHRVLVLERDPDVYPLPRAVHMDHEIMRVLQEIQLLDAVEVCSGAVDDYLFQNAAGELLLEVRGGGQLATSGFSASVMFVQPELEAGMRRRLETLPSVTTRFGGTLTDLQWQEPHPGSGVEATFEYEGTRHSARARYLVGCDGASSWVRRRLQTPMEDLGFDEPWIVVDTRVTGELDLPENIAFQFCVPERPTTCIPAGPGRRRWEFMMRPGETREAMQQPENIWPLLAPWGGPENLEIVRIAVYRFHAVIAERWQSGPVLLAGDAAHQTPPFMGQGLCSGVRDAANLAWKLHRILRGVSSHGLLRSYQAERAPHVRHVVETSVAMGRIVCELDPEKASKRDASLIAARTSGQRGPGQNIGGQVAPLTTGLVRAGDPAAGWLFPQPVVRRGGRTGRMDELTGRGFRLVVDDPRLLPDTAALQAAEIVPVVLNAEGEHAFTEVSPPRATAWLAERGVHAALVRPDHYVFGAAHNAPETARLVDAAAAMLRG